MEVTRQCEAPLRSWRQHQEPESQCPVPVSAYSILPSVSSFWDSFSPGTSSTLALSGPGPLRLRSCRGLRLSWLRWGGGKSRVEAGGAAASRSAGPGLGGQNLQNVTNMLTTCTLCFKWFVSFLLVCAVHSSPWPLRSRSLTRGGRLAAALGEDPARAFLPREAELPRAAQSGSELPVTIVLFAGDGLPGEALR